MKKLFYFSLVSLINLLIIVQVPSALAESFGYDNPIGHNSITSFAEGVLASIQGIAGWLTVIFIVIGGVIYITAGSDEGRITLAKNTIIAALIGFTLAVGGPSLLKEIQDILVGSNGSATIDTAPSFADILERTLDFILTVFGFLALLSLIYSGFVYLGFNGDSSKVDKAKKIGFYSVVAIAISGGSIIIIRTILGFLDL